MVKPFYDADLHEFRIDEYQGWWMRPLASRNEAFAAVTRRHKALDRAERKAASRLLSQENDFAWEAEGVQPLSDEEREWLRMNWPDRWWVEIVGSCPQLGDGEKRHRKRCPGCGEDVVRVGSNFRIPKKGDDRAWKEIEAMVAEGVDLEAKFSPCWTVEKHKEMVEKALEIRAKRGMDRGDAA
jgi:hypothetical protein